MVIYATWVSSTGMADATWVSSTGMADKVTFL